MRKIVSIHSRQFLAEYRAASKHTNTHDLVFFWGVLAAIGLPHLAYISYGGPVPAQLLAATIAAGVCGGLLLYRGRRSEKPTFFGKTIPRALPAQVVREKAA